MQFKTPYVAKLVYPSLTWDMPNASKKIFITFDDGPHPEITPLVLEILDKYSAKATFFCVGENVKNFPDTFHLIKENAHTVGNHSFNHLNGWKTENSNYYENVKKAAKYIDSDLFRPPYGRISPSQIKHLKKQYRIIMWSALSYDFDIRVSKEKCLELSIKNTVSGSIIVFHDSAKAKEKMLFALEGFLKHFSKRGFEFCALKQCI